MIIVDNGSTDDSIEKIRGAYPNHTLIENGENLGLSEGNNRGLQEGIKRGDDLLFLLNNDTVVAPNFLSEIVKAAQEHPNVAVFGPKIFFHDDPATIWYAGGGVDLQSGRCYHVGNGSSEGYKENKETEYVCGCALAVRSNVIKKVGLLSPEYFLMWEEIDWCYRIRKQGHSCLFVPSARVWHKVSASFIKGNRGPMWQYFYHRNRLLFHQQHDLPKKWLAKELWGLIREGIRPSAKGARAALLGVWDYYKGNFGKGRLSKYTQTKSQS